MQYFNNFQEKWRQTKINLKQTKNTLIFMRTAFGCQVILWIDIEKDSTIIRVKSNTLFGYCFLFISMYLFYPLLFQNNRKLPEYQNYNIEARDAKQQQIIIQQENKQQMNAKSKKYYQGICELNKQNVLFRPAKSKLGSEKDISKPAQNQNNRFTHLSHLQQKNSLNHQNQNVPSNMFSVPKSESKKNIISKLSKDDDFAKQIKDKVTKLPKINKEDSLAFVPGRRRMSKSYKKIATEPHQILHDDDEINMKTLSPKQNMKEVLMNIVKSKENRHLLSIDQQIDKLESLTKRYSCLRKDLVSIQEDILTISFKQKCRQKGKQASETSSIVFI